MKNKEIQVLIKADGHANLDSFPFRFGYSFPQNAQLTIRDWEPIRDETAHDPGRRKVIVGSFTLPNGSAEYKAKFVLLISDNTVITVIRNDQWLQAEYKLSEYLRGFRVKGYMSASDNIDMYNQGIRTIADVTIFLSKIMSSDKIQAVEQAAQLKIDQYEQQVQNLVGALSKSNKIKEESFIQIAQKDDEIAQKDEHLIQKDDELSQKNEALAQKDEEILRLSKAGNIIDSAKTGAPRTVNNTFKVLDAGMGTKGKYNQPAVYLDIEDGQSTTRIWNNWGRGQAARLALSQALIGEEITYDTWGNYNDEWFYHLHKV
ncbi:hypothetical protein [Candidatus Njordibacter sp. Uisw_058]|mgnify:CR=1 FL=1|jgi:hypothetical protein|uniref:hypothetical protein n=1 Tax=Candidatus Njordibacter sp. Uisw_058 TaxID=3230974 RepID=UPI003D3CE10A|tara:strand:+ start:70 stop:1020 length:951 start_codon:yes stop_codon:yes gene_type:complete